MRCEPLEAVPLKKTGIIAPVAFKPHVYVLSLFEKGDFPIKNCDFPFKHGDFPIKHGDFLGVIIQSQSSPDGLNPFCLRLTSTRNSSSCKNFVTFKKTWAID